MPGQVNAPGAALRRFVAALVVAGLAGGAEVAPARAAETCYRDPDTGRIVARRRPGYEAVPCPGAEPAPAAEDPGAEAGGDDARTRRRVADRPRDDGVPPRSRNPVSPVPRPSAEDYVSAVPMPDRWRIVDALGYENNLLDPYDRNVLKADKPVTGEWFFNLGVISDSFVELRDVVTPVGVNSTDDAGDLGVFGDPEQLAYIQNLATEFVYYKGDTVFRPPDWEFRFTPVFQYNRTELEEVTGVNVDPRRGTNRNDHFVGIQAAFVDKHLRNVSERYDFDSIRVGIQPFSSDFRGFLFQDNQLGIRLFGNRRNNVFQYNLAWFRRLEKDTNSGLNDLGKDLRDDDVFVANVYWQDLGVKGFFSQATVLWNRNREDDEFEFDKNGFIARPASIGAERPRGYDAVYLGYNGDGHFGRLNLTTSLYYALGESDPGVFVDQPVDIGALFGAFEASMDFDWIRPRVSFLYASGDDDPFDDRATGFDAVFENPQFAGADTSYWIRQATPLVGGGRVAISGRNGVLPSLRSSKELGQSNFTNPGLWLGGLGVDLDVLPELRLSANVNYLRFDRTEVLEAARNQGPIDEEIGIDASLSLTWRPLMSQNVVVRASYAQLFAGDGYDDLYPDEDPGYWLLNVLLAF
ncbi:MAG: hypothetical protein V2J02_00925 [Pseudomonadales bacterium]|jgi:hypothetical protein|nr:hypothetical protein [Pseudomonadales bacterium]